MAVRSEAANHREVADISDRRSTVQGSPAKNDDPGQDESPAFSFFFPYYSAFSAANIGESLAR